MVKNNKKNSSDIAIYKMEISMRSGDIEGVFIAEKKHIEYMVEHELYVHFGEILGKHSNVCISICDSYIKMVSDDPVVIELFKKNDLCSGYNPLFENFGCYDTDEFDEPENGIEWSDCVVDEWIDYKLDGTIPGYYKDRYEKWLISQNEKRND